MHLPNEPLVQHELAKVFSIALRDIEVDRDMIKQQLLGLSTIKELIITRNLDLIPFYQYIHQKYIKQNQSNTRRTSVIARDARQFQVAD